MRGYGLLEKLEFIDAELISEAESYKARKISGAVKFALAAACAAIIVTAALAVKNGADISVGNEEAAGGSGQAVTTSKEPDPENAQAVTSSKEPDGGNAQAVTSSKEPDGGNDTVSELPMLSISEDQSAYGYEGYMAYDISELVNENPWREDLNISSLPVFKNTVSYSAENGGISGGDFDKMRAFLIENAASLGVNTDTLEIGDDAPGEEYRSEVEEKYASVGMTVPEWFYRPSKVTAVSDGLKMSVGQAMTFEVDFTPPLPLPDEYDFNHYSPYDECLRIAEYLKEHYAGFIGYENAFINICGGDRNIYAMQSYSIEFFDKPDDITTAILNYNFNRTAFYCNDDGKLFIARKYQPDLSDKTGDYPIISADEARELLLSGNYFSSVLYEIPGEEYIAKTELIYRSTSHDEYFMPYYRFYIEIPEAERDGGLKDFVAFYVPAVEQRYIANMPSPDKSRQT